MDDRMKIVILEGSPNRQGSSHMLAEDRFCAINGSIQRKEMRSALISAAWADTFFFTGD